MLFREVSVKALKITLALAILIVLFIFCLNNAHMVQVVFLSYQTPEVPLFLIILFVFVLGLLLGLLFSTFQMTRLRREISQARKSLDAIQNGTKKADSQSPPTMGTPPAEN